MIKSPIPHNEAKRLNELLEYNLLDTPAEKEFDDIVKLASTICEAPISLISLIDATRSWGKAAIGLESGTGPRDTSFCGHVILKNEFFEIPDTLKDERFFDNPFVLNAPNVRFYAGYPLTTASGSMLGSLCVIDTVPRELNEFQKFALQVLSENVIKIAELRIRNRQLKHISEPQKKMTPSWRTMYAVRWCPCVLLLNISILD